MQRPARRARLVEWPPPSLGKIANKPEAQLFNTDLSSPDFDAVRFIGGMARVGHNGLVGMRYHAHGPDWAELALDHRDELVGDLATGVIASGPIFTTMDMALSISVWLKAGIFRPHATLDLRVDWLRAAEPCTTIYARGDCYRLSRSIAFVRGEAHDGDAARPVAHVIGTYIST